MNYNNAYWNKISKSYNLLGKLLTEYKEREYKDLINKWVPKLSRKTILKTDLFEEVFEKNSFSSILNSKNLVGIDISNTVCLSLKKKANSNIKRIVNCDIRKLPFKKNSFNLIISSSTLDHFSKEDLIKSLQELNYILEENRTIILTLNNKNNFLMYLLIKIEYILKIKLYPCKFYSIKDIKKICEETNYEIIDYDYIYPIFPLISKLLNIFEKFNSIYINQKLKMILFNFRKVIRKSNFLKKYFGLYVAIKLKKCNH